MEVLAKMDPEINDTLKSEMTPIPAQSMSKKTESTTKKGRPKKAKNPQEDNHNRKPPNTQEPKKRKNRKIEKVRTEVQSKIEAEGHQNEVVAQVVVEDELLMWRENGEQIKNIHAQLSEISSQLAKKFKDKKHQTYLIVKELRKLNKKLAKVDQMMQNPIQGDQPQVQEQPQLEQVEQNAENKMEQEAQPPIEVRAEEIIEQVQEKQEEVIEPAIQDQITTPPPPPVIPTTPKTDEKKKKSNNSFITGWVKTIPRKIIEPTAGLFKTSGSRESKIVSDETIQNLDKYFVGDSKFEEITMTLHCQAYQTIYNKIQEEFQRRVFLKLHDSQIMWKGERFNKKSDQINGRRPFGIDKYHIDYEVESEEELNAESIKSKGDEDEEDEISEEDSLSQIKFVEDGHFSEDELVQESDPNQPKLIPKIDRPDYFSDDGNTKQYSYFQKTSKPETFNLYAMQLLDDTKTYPVFKKTFFSDRLHMVQFIKALHGSFISQINFINEITKDFPDCTRQAAEKKLKQIADKQKFEYNSGQKDRWIVRPEVLKEYSFSEEYANTLVSDREMAFITQKQQKLEKKKLEQSDKKKQQDETMEKYLKQQSQLPQSPQDLQHQQQLPITQPQQQLQPPP